MSWWLNRSWWNEELRGLSDRLPRPNPEQTWDELWTQLNGYLELYAVGYLWKVSNRWGVVYEVHLLEPMRVCHCIRSHGVETYRVELGGGKVTYLEPAVVLVVKKPQELPVELSGYRFLEEDGEGY